MKLKTLAAVTLSLASLIATAQTLELNFNGSSTNGTFATDGFWFGGDNGGSPFVGGLGIFNGTAPFGASANGLSSLNSTATLTGQFNNYDLVGTGALAGFDYAYVFFKVNAASGLTAGLTTTLTLTDNPALRDYSFMNGTNSITLAQGSTDLQFWRGFSVLSPGGNAEFAGQGTTFSSLLDGTLTNTLSNLTSPFLTTTFTGTGGPSGTQQEAIFVTVIRATNS